MIMHEWPWIVMVQRQTESKFQAIHCHLITYILKLIHLSSYYILKLILLHNYTLKLIHLYMHLHNVLYMCTCMVTQAKIKVTTATL